MKTLLLLLLAALGYAAWTVGDRARKVTEGSPGMRQLLLWGGLIAAPAGVLVALVLPEQINFNRESPAGLFYVYLPCFLVGGALFAGGIGAFIGALRARGVSEE